jgi:hypothetical protein
MASAQDQFPGSAACAVGRRGPGVRRCAGSGTAGPPARHGRTGRPGPAAEPLRVRAAPGDERGQGLGEAQPHEHVPRVARGEDQRVHLAAPPGHRVGQQAQVPEVQRQDGHLGSLAQVNEVKSVESDRLGARRLLHLAAAPSS